ncbi:MAG: flagellar hook basal-body protein [Myxococcaceae bacterium]
MADGIYVSMNGAAARLAQLDSIADNLANAQTPGFKAERPSFESFLARADGKDSPRVYPAAVATNVDLRPGAMVQTNNPLDVTPTGNAFIGVQTSKGIALTRNGHLQVTGDGRLMAAGHAVVDRDGNAITLPPGATVRVEPSGAVFANDMLISKIGLFDVHGNVDRVGPSLLMPHDQKAISPSADGLRLGEIETGNASPLEAAVQLVAAQRHFENSMQALQTYRRMDERASEVGKTR